MAFHIRQSPLHAVVLEGEALVVEAEEVEDGGVEVVERVDVLHRALAEVVGHAVADAGLHARAREPAGEAIGVVVAALRALLEEGHPAKLRAPDDERVLQQAALWPSQFNLPPLA